MNLPKLFGSAEPTVSPLFFAIQLTDTYARAALWQVNGSRVEVMSQSEVHEWQDLNSCVNAVDQSLQELGKESEKVKQTLFALPNHWVSAEGILPAQKPLFQKITKELSLEAAGFVVTSEALVQHLSAGTLAQLSVVLVEVELQQVKVWLVKQGQSDHSEVVGRSGDMVSDLTEALAHFNEKTLPTKIVLFSGLLTQEELEDVRQQLMGNDWTANKLFLHPPIVELFAKEGLMEVLIQTGGRALAESKSLLEPGAIEPQPAETKPEVEMQLSPPLDGITEGDNVRIPTDDALLVDTQASTFGVPVSAGHLHATTDVPSANEVNAPRLAGDHVSMFEPTRSPIAPTPGKGLARLKYELRKHALFVVGGVLGGAAVLFLIAFVAAQQVTSATITIELSNKHVAKDTTLILDSNINASDPQRLLLKANTENIRVEGEKTAETTGTKVIGDKAKGKVVIYNRTSSAKTFPAGTTLKIEKYSFTLNDSVTVASASTGSNFETRPGTTEAQVVAAEIGSEYNIESGKDLVIDNFSTDTYVARSSNAFTGGTSREIKAVSKEDRDALTASLKKELSDKAAAQMKESSTGGRFYIPTHRVKVISSKFDAEVGKETNSLSLEMSLEAESLVYQSADLKPLATTVLASEVPAGYQLTDSEPQILSSPSSSATGSARVELETNLSAVATPVLDLEAVKQEIAGKSETEARSLLKAKTGVKEVTIQREPGLLATLWKKLPKKIEKITVVTK